MAMGVDIRHLSPGDVAAALAAEPPLLRCRSLLTCPAASVYGGAGYFLWRLIVSGKQWLKFTVKMATSNEILRARNHHA